MLGPVANAKDGTRATKRTNTRIEKLFKELSAISVTH
jgi:hypothetical protein